MKTILILIPLILLISCTTPKYNKLDKVNVYGIEVIITRVFGVGNHYEGRYVDDLGFIQTVHFYETEIKD